MFSLANTLVTILLASPVFSTAIPQDATAHSYGDSKRALYFLENDPAGAKLAAISVDKDDMLSALTRTPTGGNGAVGLNATDTTQELRADTLFGQGAVAVGGNYVFTVNPGSNSLSMFRIDPRHPTDPKLVGKPADTMGEFPVSVAYSQFLRQACVLNGGAKSGITCFRVTKYGLQAIDKAPRDISKYLHATTPPQGPPQTASQIAFSPDSRTLAVTIKGQPATKTPGYFLLYPVRGNRVGTDVTATQIDDILMPFGFTFLDTPTRIFVSDATFGGSIVSTQSRGNTLHASEVAHVDAPDLKASCWAAYSNELRAAYAIDAATPRIAVVPLDTGKLAGYIEVEPTLGGVFDAAVDGKRMFFLAQTGSLGVVDLASRSMVQTFTPGANEVGPRKYWQGLALWSETMTKW